jgi:hypothetical protein
LLAEAGFDERARPEELPVAWWVDFSRRAPAWA